MNIASVDSLQSNAQFNLRLVQFEQKKRVDIYLDCEEFFILTTHPRGLYYDMNSFSGFQTIYTQIVVAHNLVADEFVYRVPAGNIYLSEITSI